MLPALLAFCEDYSLVTSVASNIIHVKGQIYINIYGIYFGNIARLYKHDKRINE